MAAVLLKINDVVVIMSEVVVIHTGILSLINRMNNKEYSYELKYK